MRTGRGQEEEEAGHNQRGEARRGEARRGDDPTGLSTR
jgi:hypothetical protein